MAAFRDFTEAVWGLIIKLGGMYSIKVFDNSGNISHNYVTGISTNPKQHLLGSQ